MVRCCLKPESNYNIISWASLLVWILYTHKHHIATCILTEQFSSIEHPSTHLAHRDLSHHGDTYVSTRFQPTAQVSFPSSLLIAVACPTKQSLGSRFSLHSSLARSTEQPGQHQLKPFKPTDKAPQSPITKPTGSLPSSCMANAIVETD